MTMSYTEQGITILAAVARDGGVLLRLGNANADKVLQCYVNGVLATWQPAPAVVWACELAGVTGADEVFVLAVDAADAATSFYDLAAPAAVSRRLRVRLMRKIAPYRPGDRWRIYRGDAGAPAATRLATEIPLRAGAHAAVGFGHQFGAGGFGWDGAAAVGFGGNFGLGEFGFDAEQAGWQSDALPPGGYPLRVVTVDAAGNESPAAAATVMIASPPRPASSLSPTQYDPTTDTLTFTFTPSKDVN
jgi:hypothetical protein